MAARAHELHADHITLAAEEAQPLARDGIRDHLPRGSVHAIASVAEHAQYRGDLRFSIPVECSAHQIRAPGVDLDLTPPGLT